MTVLFIILAELLFVSILILSLYRLKPRLGLVPLYVVLGSNQLFVTLLGTKLDLDILGGLSIPVAPSIIFTGGFFAILLIYIKEGVQATQKLIIAIVIANLSLTILTSLSNWSEMVLTGSSSVTFFISFRIFIMGMVSLILDAFIMIILYEVLYTKLRILSLYSRLVLTMLIILNFDSFLFVTTSFWEQPDYSSRLISHVFGKSITALFFATVLYLYLRFFDKKNETRSEVKGNEDIFSILTYKGRFEKLKTEKAISDEYLQSIITEKTKELEKSINRFTIMASVRELRMDKFTSAEQAKEFLDKVKEAFEIDACTVHVIKNNQLELLSSIGLEAPELEKVLELTNPFFDEIIKRKKFLTIEDTSLDIGLVKKREMGEIKFYYKSCIGVPLISDKKAVGVLKLYSRNEKRIFSILEIEHLQLIANELTSLFENASLFEQNEKHKEVLVKQIVARKKVEEAIKQSEEKYRNLIQRASDAIMVYQFDGSIISSNTAACNLLGYTEEEFQKLKLKDLVFDEDLKVHPIQFEAIRAGKTTIDERRVKCKDGSAIIVELNTKLMPDGTLMVVGRDLTERKKAEAERAQLLLRNQQIINTMQDGYFLIDQFGKILETNPAYCRIVGYDREELIGKNITMIEKMTTGEIDEKIQQIAQSKYLLYESRNITKEKKHIDVEVSASVLFSGEEPLLAGFVKDITDRKKIQEQIKTYNEQLRQLTGHLQTIREEERYRIGREVHDGLGQYLTVLKMDVSRLKKNIKQGKHKEEDLTEILNELDNCLSTVRKISTDLRPSILDDLGIIAAMEWQAEDFEKRTEIKTSFNSNISYLSLPATHSIGLFRIFQESLTNVARHAEADVVEAKLKLDNGSVEMTISDNGKGFEKKSIAHKRSLGLLGMKERTQLMNGEYEINSVPGKGTEVKVTIPV